MLLTITIVMYYTMICNNDVLLKYDESLYNDI
jgi:hypothetical protein